MTTLYPTKKTCSVCELISDQTGISSTNEFGSPDLDTRPPEMKRSTISHWVENCPHCGYCNSSIEDSIDGISEIVYSDTYKKLLVNNNYSQLVCSFLCQSFLYESLGEYTKAIWPLFNAAWVCDDNRNYLSAKKCRLKAFELLEIIWKSDEKLIKQIGSDYILATDLLRRSGEFEKAKSIIEIGFECQPDEFISKLLQAQKILIDNGSDLCYTIEDALKLVEKH